jgi:hypothetical protein
MVKAVSKVMTAAYHRAVGTMSLSGAARRREGADGLAGVRPAVVPSDPQARFLSGITRTTITVMMKKKKNPRMPKSTGL